MRIHVATTTKFHLSRLARELSALGQAVSYSSYAPRYRLRQEGLATVDTRSLFLSLLPYSALALSRGAPWQSWAVEEMLSRTDRRTTALVPPCDFYIGLSSMAVESAAAARALGATVIIDRGSRHVLSQTRLVSREGATGLSTRYIERELASYEEADFITVLSQHSADSFIEEGHARDQIFVCPPGVDVDVFQPSPAPQGPTSILFVGSWSYQKGVDVLTAAVRRRPRWRLTHIGIGGDIEFPAGDSRFIRLGHKGHEQLAKVMSQHHVLVLPSRQDGFGLVLLEALAAGLPVVASRMTGAPDIQAELHDPLGVEIVEPGDVGDLLRGLDTVIERELQHHGTRPRQKLTHDERALFSWRGYGARYLAFLQRNLGRHSRRA